MSKRSSDTPVVSVSVSSSSNNNSNAKNHRANEILGKSTKLRVRIKKFHAVSMWTWNVGNGSDDEVCGICQEAFEGCPPGVKFPGDESPVVFGTCGELIS